jgi:transposase
MLIAAINRAICPKSKTQIGDWFENTVGPRLLGVKANQLSSQGFWNHMERLKPDILIQIENEFLVSLIDNFGIDLNRLLYDGTNFYTYINTKTNSDLAQRGKNKQKRNDLRQVSLGMMTSSDFHIPLLHMVYGGNVNDSKQFGSVINVLINRYKHLTQVCPHITLVFDKGNNSESNFESFKGTGFHFVGSLKLNQCPDLLEIPLKKYQVLKGKQLESVKAYRVKQTIFAEERTVVVTYNENLLAGQLQGIGINLAKSRVELKELQLKLKRWACGKIRKGKKPTLQGVQKKVDKILSREFMKKIIKVTLSSGKWVQIQFHVDQNAIPKLCRTVLGKTLLFTDNHEWTNEEIISAYRGQYQIEHAFKKMKNPHFLGWNPRFHWTDQKIRVHAFYCVASLTLVSLLKRKLYAKGVSLSVNVLMRNLIDIRETISVYPPKNKTSKPVLSYSMSHLNKTQKILYKFLELEKYRLK